MVFRELLIVHRSNVVRNILKGYVLSENSDISVEQAGSGEVAEDLLKARKFDMIMCSQYLKNWDALQVNEARLSSPLNAKTPFIVFTSSREERNIRELKKSGIEHLLLAPFEAHELQHLLTAVCNPRTLRVQPRFNVPNIIADFEVGGEMVTGSVINISKSSILLEAEFKENYPDFSNLMNLTIEFPPEYHNVVICDITSRILSFKALSWHPDDRPRVIQMVLIFKKLKENYQRQWIDILDQIERNYLKWSTIQA
jgi:CheY-like chemotaxis protein